MQAQIMFDDGTYKQLLGIIRLVVKQSKMDNDNFEVEFVSQIFIFYLLMLFAFLFYMLFCSLCFFCGISIFK